MTARPSDRYRAIERDRLFQLAVEISSDPTRDAELQAIARDRLTGPDLDFVNLDLLTTDELILYRACLRKLAGQPERVIETRKPVVLTDEVAAKIDDLLAYADLGYEVAQIIWASRERAEAAASCDPNSKTDSP